jgi:hypothetical protein
LFALLLTEVPTLALRPYNPFSLNSSFYPVTQIMKGEGRGGLKGFGSTGSACATNYISFVFNPFNLKYERLMLVGFA